MIKNEQLCQKNNLKDNKRMIIWNKLKDMVIKKEWMGIVLMNNNVNQFM